MIKTKLNLKFWKNKTLFVSGGTGTFGKNFLKKIINMKLPIKKLIIFSRDELKQSELKSIYPISKYKFLRYFIGDIRDKDRLELALKDVDIIFHAAALKQVDTAEYNPFEYVNTNIIGSQNIINAAIKNNVSRVVALSTDKACSPINLYGVTKLASEKLFISANNYSGGRTSFSTLRYGNVSASRGSVIPLFLKCKENNENFFPITSTEMTRFWIEIDEAINLALDLAQNMIGGETLIPIIPSFKIKDLAKAIDDKKKIKIIGIRPGEKIHEEMIGSHESLRAFKGKKYYYILSEHSKRKREKIIRINNLKKLSKNFKYSSNENNFMSIKDIKSGLKKVLNDTLF